MKVQGFDMVQSLPKKQEKPFEDVEW